MATGKLTQVARLSTTLLLMPACSAGGKPDSARDSGLDSMETATDGAASSDAVGSASTDSAAAELDAHELPLEAGSADGAEEESFPGPANTGPDLSGCPGGALEKYTGADDYRPKSGEVVRCREFQNRSLYISSEVSNVTIEHCLFTTTRDLFLNVQGSHVTIQDSELRGPAGTWIRNSYEGAYLTVRRNDFSGMANAVEFNVGHETIEDNYIHDFGTVSSDQHADGLQSNGTAHAVVRHNTVLLNPVAGATGAIAFFDDGDDILVERNKVAGGGYTIYPGGAGTTNIRFVDNCFSTLFYPGKAQSGAFGPWYPSANPPGLVRTGNTWCDGPNAGQALDRNP